MKPIEVTYIDSGAFQGGEEDVFEAGIKPDQECVVLTAEEYSQAIDAVKVVAYLESHPMSIVKWDDGRWTLVNTKNLTTAMIVPTLHELAEKLEAT